MCLAYFFSHFLHICLKKNNHKYIYNVVDDPYCIFYIFFLLLCFPGQNGKYLHFHDDGFSADAELPVPYFLELRDPTRICIKTAQGITVG